MKNLIAQTATAASPATGELAQYPIEINPRTLAMQCVAGMPRVGPAKRLGDLF